MLVEKQYAKAGTHHPSFSISIRQCLITQKKKKTVFPTVRFWGEKSHKKKKKKKSEVRNLTCRKKKKKKIMVEPREYHGELGC